MNEIFVSALGQLDNIGDSALRRGYLNALRFAGRLHVLMPDDDSYNSGLGLRAEDIRYLDRRKWRAAALRRAVAGHAGFALNAGEATLDADYTKYCGRIAAIAALARFRGSTVVIAGSGFRPGFLGDRPADDSLLAVAPWPVRTLARRSAFVGWRDEQTRRAVDVGSVMPDWAFGLGQPSDRLLNPRQGNDRDLLVVSLRAAGPALSPERGRQIKELADRHGVEPVVAVQVVRDNDLAKKVSDDNGFRCLPWHGGDHLEREAMLRALYARSRWVISNRVHALILGLTEGAIPLAPIELGAEKSVRIFRAAGISDVAVPGSAQLPTAGDTADRCVSELAGARAALDQSARRLVDALAPGRADLIPAIAPVASRPPSGGGDPGPLDRPVRDAAPVQGRRS
jgi:hypothetical protein